MSTSTSRTTRASERPEFRTPGTEAAFLAAYDAALARWPLPATPIDCRSEYGTTRINACGPADGRPVVLLPSGGATSTVWYANVAALAATHRVYAVDLIGDAGRSVRHGRPIRRAEDLAGWLDSVLDRLGLATTAMVGHSYGGWMALGYALHAPHRVTRLALLDPTQCFAGFRPGYLLRAVPLLLRPTAARARDFIAWETGGAPAAGLIDPAWSTVHALGTADFPRSKPVTGPRPSAGQLRALTVPTLVLTAERSRTHDGARVAAAARALLPHVEAEVLPGLSHHAMPMTDPGPLNDRLTRFLDREA
ncbi:alpha/beta fold hydrolase [Saccharothrix sp. ST-888]|uniref:alpha/beta fold hydrolase n=1 Tax=Saccharothrix sp. ST-888 TaxID=1427391 RepID=UPI0009E365E5|nr:alpha/beta hydrolase [Saccharothrix sp. ST-888]